MYSDCTPDNRCGGCNQCTCSAQGTWVCETTTEGCQEDPDDDTAIVDDKLIDSALDSMVSELKGRIQPEKKRPHVPLPSPPPETILVRKINKVPAWDDYAESAKEDEAFIVENLRRKRSTGSKTPNTKGNKTIIFHHTVDELNEDTLKNTNASGTLAAVKVEIIPLVARRNFPLNNSLTPLQIEYTPPLQSHAGDNKVDSTALHDDQLDLLVHHKMYEMKGNHSQASRDKDLSKLVVNELKGGAAETIGDKNSPVISNITFTPENDTLTAMAFIAGNLLNKLWNIERDSEDSLETEHMKHKKIDDLLELFKEPLNLRQETFLKNALQHLSTAIENKNVGNVTLCKNIEELKKTSGLMNELKPSKQSFKSRSNTTTTTETIPTISTKTAATEALNKIGDIIDLIKKFERAQSALNNIKNSSNVSSTIKNILHKEENNNDLTKDEKVTLNVFGNILESLTKLIMPNKKGKKIIKQVKTTNVFNSDKDVKDRLPNLNISDISLTTKDKIVLDYLTHIQNSPSCLLKNNEQLLHPDIEGDILLNLSEFFKIKSMSDLIKLVDTENKKESNNLHETETRLDLTSYENFYTTETITTKASTTEKGNDNIRVETTKEKLKVHLKTVLEDIMELQNINGKSINRKNIEISDVLPCIYNLLSNRKLTIKNLTKIQPKITLSPVKFNVNPVNKISEIVNNLKKELKQTTQTRRTNVGNGKMPKSAIVWERTVKNLGTKNELLTRRNFGNNVPKSFDDVKTILNEMESSGSNTYKSIAYFAKIPPAERLLLLKTLSLDTKKYLLALSDIKRYIEYSTTLALDHYKILSEFIENVNINLNLNDKIITTLDKPKKDLYLSNKPIVFPKNVNTAYNTPKVEPTKAMNTYSRTKEIPIKSLRADNTVKEVGSHPPVYSTVKLSRDQIVNQLIKNRMMYYLKLKEDPGDRKSEIDIELAKKIILHLERGNNNLARELFKIFIIKKQKTPVKAFSNPKFDSVKYKTKPEIIQRKKTQIPEPLIQFEDADENKEPWLYQDQLMKQLTNIKNMMV